MLAEPCIQPGRGVVWDYSNRSQGEVSGMPTKKPPIYWHSRGNTKEYAELSAACRCRGCALVPVFLLLGAWHLINFTVNSVHRSILTKCHFDLSAGWGKKKMCISHYPCSSLSRGISHSRRCEGQQRVGTARMGRFLEEAQSWLWSSHAGCPPPPPPASIRHSFPVLTSITRIFWGKIFACLFFF